MPEISIIVPCYNQAQYLDECLQSVLNQTYQDWECIIVDDGSPDNTEKVVKKWIEKDSRFQYLKKKTEAFRLQEIPVLKKLKESGYFRWMVTIKLALCF
jgi:glycosyltransferase involved in cell wall biosynthesis